MRTYETKFDFTRAKSQKRITKPSVVTGQMPKAISFFYRGMQPASALHDPAHKRKANVKPNETRDYV